MVFTVASHAHVYIFNLTKPTNVEVLLHSLNYTALTFIVPRFDCLFILSQFYGVLKRTNYKQTVLFHLNAL